MYSDTITLFNRYESRAGDTWYATVLHNVHLNIDKAAILAKYGAESSDAAMLNVKYDLVNGKIMIQGKTWLPPKEWDKQLNDDYSHTITFTDGSMFDFFMVGEWADMPDDGVIMDEDYDASGGFYNYMNDKYDYVFAISKVGGPYTVIPHFEITGR